MIRSLGRRIAILAAILLSGFPATGEAQHTDPFVVRLGYTTFDGSKILRGDSTLQSVTGFLRKIAQRSSEEPAWKRPVRFELALGNYYQIWSWFRTGQIDAAVVSPFMAMLLERDRQAVSIIEFSEGEDPAAHHPFVAATGRWSQEPLQGVDEYLQALLDAVREGEPGSDAVRTRMGKIREAFRFDLVAHLSSSGFIMPALYAQEWLDSEARGDLEDDVKRRFWHVFFENANLTLDHDDTYAGLPVSTIKFSYDHGQEAEEPFGPWRRYPAGGRLPAGVPSIPNDVLIIRRQVVDEALGPGAGAADRARLGELLLSPEIEELFRTPTGSYRTVRLFNPDVQDRFRQEVDRLFGRADLKPLFERWFDHGLFDFTIDETMGFLRQDQQNSGLARLSLVLSGGGVKSLYQTVLLDHLYGLGEDSRRQLRNFDEPPMRAAGSAPLPDEPLTVHTFIGTSGGAMLAFFAAQMPETGSLRRIVEETSEKPLFPITDLPRLLSIFVLLTVLALVLLVVKALDWRGYRTRAAKAVEKTGSLGVMMVELLLVVVGAAAIVTTRSEYMETVPVAEATFFILTAVAVHFGVTCITRAGGAPRHAALGRLARLALAFGIQLVVIAVAARHVLGPAPAALHEVQFPALSVLASAGVFVIAAAIAAGAAAGLWGLAIQGAERYVAAFAAAAVVVSLSFLVVAGLSLANRGTLLELTALYWINLLAAAVVVSVGALYFAQPERARFLRFLHGGFVELMRERRGALTTTLASTFVGVFAFCLGCWALLVAPAVYSNVKAVKAFSEALPQEKLWTNRFHSNLVVTGTLLQKAQCSEDVVDEGGLYFCFEGPEGCGASSHGQWQVFRRPAPARAVDAVFASGSAFPVFPPHRAHLPNGCEVRLIDGGYAHNVPLEAAAMSEARQVLILNASPDPSHQALQPQSGWSRFLRRAQLEGGQLIRSSPDVLAFMFARAQDLDRNIGGDLVVASLEPRPDDGWWPFLLDFRQSVREHMTTSAERDIRQNRRIGHIRSWGRPALLHELAAEP